MAQSFTGRIQTEGEYVTVSSLTDITFASSTTYTMQIQNTAYIKVGDAEFCVSNEKFQYTTTTDDLYIKTESFQGCILTILEEES